MYFTLFLSYIGFNSRPKQVKLPEPSKEKVDRLIARLDELCKYLCLSKQSIYDLVYHKKVPFTKIGRRLRFQKALIDEWVKTNTHSPFDLKPKISYNIQVEGFN